MPIVDASVVVDWIAPGVAADNPSKAVLDGLATSGDSLVAPRQLIAEVSNVLLTGVRRRRWSGAEADEAHDQIDDLPVMFDDDSRDLGRAWELARRFDNYPYYDMIYVALAERRKMPLISVDLRLHRAMARVGVLFVLTPEDLLR